MVLHGTGGTGGAFMSRTFGGELFGPGQLLDTAQYYVILPDGIGHGKSSKPSDGMHARFPQYTYNDMVDAQHELLTKGLGVNHLRLVMGTSMGCMHAWVWGERYPGLRGRPRSARVRADTDRRAESYDPDDDHGLHPRRSGLQRRRLRDAAGGPPAGDGDAVHHDVGAEGAAPPGADARQGGLRDPRVSRTSIRADKDANDVVYEFNASRNYDPSANLEKITAHVLAINSADDFVNPPELGVVEQLMPRVKNGKFILLPITDQTRGHGTHSLPAIWKGYLAEFLKGLPRADRALPSPSQRSFMKSHSRGRARGRSSLALDAARSAPATHGGPYAPHRPAPARRAAHAGDGQHRRRGPRRRRVVLQSRAAGRSRADSARRSSATRRRSAGGALSAVTRFSTGGIGDRHANGRLRRRRPTSIRADRGTMLARRTGGRHVARSDRRPRRR